ncbi:MAG TPA: hypothetical protein DCP69_07990 [Candidatus Omnitrophica bacterium]|nr:hypothetical protein [Candidatus Omnitrophota bacterium]
MRGKLAEAQDNQRKLLLKAEGLCTSIRRGLNTALTPFNEMEIPQVASQMDDLVMAWVELQKTQSDMNRLERELR